MDHRLVRPVWAFTVQTQTEQLVDVLLCKKINTSKVILAGCIFGLCI